MNFPYKTNYYPLFFLFLVVFSTTIENISYSQISFTKRPKILNIALKEDSLIYKLDDSSTMREKEDISFSKSITIPYKYNSVYFGIDTCNIPDGTCFQFYLAGHDKNWGKLYKYPLKEYSNLSPGSYIFNVRFNSKDRIPSASTSFQFKILSPFYMTRIAIFIYLVTALLLFLAVAKVFSYRFARERFRLERIINERTDELIKEKDKSENLIANLLPKDTADELKTKGKATKRKYQMATVLFSDIQGFTRLAEQMNPETLIDILDSFYLHFDTVVEKYNIEKIKTIGDAYMCAGGIPEKNRTNPVEVIMAALEMQQYLKELHKKPSKKNTRLWDIRIGIHTGSVIAGVVGHKKLSYDIWGDTVNIASRMESSGEAGKINISGSTYELVKDFFNCEYRGKMPVKYKGEIDMYFVKGIRPDLQTSPLGLPNKKFFIHLQLLRLNDLDEAILKILQEKLPQNLYYHNYRHTMHVYTQVELLGRAEKISDDEMLLVRTAALLHDSGFMNSYENHEKLGCDYAKEILPDYKYSEEQISKICELIMITSRGSKPKTPIEKVICDADSDYLGRVDYKQASMDLYNELKEQKKVNSLNEWKESQAQLIKEHELYTKTAIVLRDINKKEQLKNVHQLTDKN